ncbi:DNA-(apurinic or apyrimidinic site) lyase [Aphelenchoides besseyi]|nr:DNA-(apurinic or apyrimidinic site) lyase [Aphelenchoides besseyi]KAI6218111.1 DNA-(apurinic or apyrimidinic site) lyase [Aphelenchoides besseyi]
MPKRLFPIFNNLEDQSESSSSKRSRGEALKIWSWNVAGLRAAVKKGAADAIMNSGADIVLLQETKCTEFPPEIMRLDMYPYKRLCFGKEHKGGYAGVAMLAKEKPLKCKLGIGDERFDNHGRFIHAEYEDFHLLTAYVLNSGAGLKNLSLRKEWDDMVREKMIELDKQKPVIYGGDLNVAHNEIDLKNPETNHKTAGFTDQEREYFGRLLDSGFVDVWRKRNPKTVGYTYWSYKFNAYNKNMGWRLDYYVISERIFENVEECEIHRKIRYSDHAPISLIIRI